MSDEVVSILERIAADVPKCADELRDLDARIGDGDLGFTVSKGLEGVTEALPGLKGMPPGDQLARAGMAFNRVASSTFGVLFATALMRGGGSIRGNENPGAGDVAAIGRAALEGMMDRGKAKLGDKTLLDVLAPAIDAFEESLEGGASLPDAADAAVAACEKGVEATVSMQSKVSRASWLGERSIGVQDPGGTAVLYMLRAAADWVRENKA